MTNWYRKKTWTTKDEEEFFAKLGRAREYNRVQYLRVQATELIETKDKYLLSVAENLLNKILTDYPDDKTNKSQTYNSLGEIYKLREDLETALMYFQKALEFENEFPNVITTAYLNFSETVIRLNKINLYDAVEKILTRKIDKNQLAFSLEKYITYSAMAIIFQYKGDTKQASVYAELAESNATVQTNLLWNPQKIKLGLVKNRITWLDKLVGRK